VGIQPKQLEFEQEVSSEIHKAIDQVVEEILARITR
jgi:hypothetical protein